MRIAAFGPTLLSSLRNPHATYFRGILNALHARGHTLHYFEAETPDEHRDLPVPPWQMHTRYASDPEAALRAVESASKADLLIKASRAGSCGALITEALLDLQGPGCQVAFWDTDPSVTLAAIHQHPASPLHRLIPRFDRVITNGGGATAMAAYRGFGAHQCTVIYPAIDPAMHHRVASEERFRCDLAILADRLPCNEAQTQEFLLNQADQLPNRRFLIAGRGWDDLPPRANLDTVGHLPPNEQNSLNASAFAVLSLNSSDAERSPSPHLFEAAGIGACLLTDRWTGIEDFFEPEREIIVAQTGEEAAWMLDALDPERARAIGEAALRRVLGEHTYTHRALQVEQML